MESVAYEQLANTEERGWYYQARLAVVGYLLARVGFAKSRAGISVLDVGCGTGGSTAFLSAYGQVTGVEPNAQARDLLKLRFPHLTLVPADIDGMKTKLTGKTFDLVSVLGVLYHRNVHDPLKAMQTIASCQHSGGYLVWNEACYEALWREHDNIVQGARRFTPKGMRDVVAAAGYETLDGGHLIAWGFPIAFALGLWFRIKTKFGVRPAQEAVDHAIPSAFINHSLYLLTVAEWQLAKLGIKFPFGVSYILIAKKT